MATINLQESYDFDLRKVQHNGLYFRGVHIRNRTVQMCYAAITNDVRALQHMSEPSIGMKYAAIEMDGMALQFIEDQTEELCRIAVLNNPYAVVHVKDEKLRAWLQLSL